MKTVLGIFTACFMIMMLTMFKTEISATPAAPSFSQEDTTVYPYVEQMPYFGGGDTGLTGFIMQNLVYPQVAKDSGYEGRVLISFIVEKDGRLSNIQLAGKKPVRPELTQEALRVVKLLPPFEKPGMKEGKPVRVKMALPIQFKLT